MSEQRLHDRLQLEMEGCRSMLDVGSGPGKYLAPLAVQRKAALDAYSPYLDQIRDLEKYHGRAERILPILPTGSFDAVMALDFIEHLEKDDALSVIAEMKRIAIRKVIVFTPEGFHPQSPGMPGSTLTQAEWVFQEHRSGWTAAELEALGFTVERWEFDYGKGEAMSSALWGVLAKH